MFRKPHTVILRSEGSGQDPKEDADLSSDQIVNLFSIKTFQDIDAADDMSTVETNLGERNMVINGPVIVHGYSAEVFGAFHGSVYQGLSRYDTDLLSADINSKQTHDYSSVFENPHSTTNDKINMDKCIKNFKFHNGFMQDPYDAAAADVASFSVQQMQWARTDLDKKLSRTSLESMGRKTFKKTTKSGLVLVPNSSTEYFTINLKNLQSTFTSGDSPAAGNDGPWYARISVWMSWDINLT